MSKLLKTYNFHVNSLLYTILAAIKRFYKKTGVLQGDGKFEITLDHRKLKTPTGTLFAVESEPLAYAIAQEWDAQSGDIERTSMILTALSNTVIDNPNHLTKLDIINFLLHYAETDTVLFHDASQPKLLQLQEEQWNPVVDWFNERYHTKLERTVDISPPAFPENAKMQIVNHLKSYDLPALHGIQFAVETLKSIVLAFACIDRHLTPEKAVLLSRLEEEYQLGFWGRVEWAHDMTQQDLQARLSAAVYHVHCHSFSNIVKKKITT